MTTKKQMEKEAADQFKENVLKHWEIRKRYSEELDKIFEERLNLKPKNDATEA